MNQQDKYLTLTQENFNDKVLRSNQPVLVDFWAEWCPPCRAIGPSIQELAAEVEGSAVVGKVNIDEQEALAQKYDVRSIPTLLFFRDGEIVDRTIGVVPKAYLAEKLESLSATSQVAS